MSRHDILNTENEYNDYCFETILKTVNQVTDDIFI